MSVMKIDSLTEVHTLREEMDRLLDRSRRQRFSETSEPQGWRPPADIYEDARGLVIEMEVPGMREEEIVMRLEESALIIEGERGLPGAEQGRHYHRIERAYGSFSRSFFLPAAVDRANIQAVCEEGLLIVTVPLNRGSVDPVLCKEG